MGDNRTLHDSNLLSKYFVPSSAKVIADRRYYLRESDPRERYELVKAEVTESGATRFNLLYVPPDNAPVMLLGCFTVWLDNPKPSIYFVAKYQSLVAADAMMVALSFRALEIHHAGVTR